MNFLFLSIISCLLLSHTNYASENRAWHYSFPVATAVRRIVTHVFIKTDTPSGDTKNTIPKNLSRNTLENVNDEQFWSTVHKNEVIDLNNIDPTLLKDYYQTTSLTTTSQISPATHSPNRARSESFSAIHTDPFALCNNNNETNKAYSSSFDKSHVSVGAIEFSKTSSTSTSNPKSEDDDDQCFLSNICKCCFKKNQ
ncbi:MAG: hypothetical protein Q8Q60_05330 [Candidatus Chromulinivorax sp.]|nr:hypothetical protein [Candidatus Chromulinivorax sp.]